jgi:hypothetical protein
VVVVRSSSMVEEVIAWVVVEKSSSMVEEDT